MLFSLAVPFLTRALFLSFRGGPVKFMGKSPEPLYRAVPGTFILGTEFFPLLQSFHSYSTVVPSRRVGSGSVSANHDHPLLERPLLNGQLPG